MADEKDIIVEFLKGKSASKSKFYFKDFTELFPDKGPREVKKILTKLVNKKCWNSGLPAPPPCTASRAPVSRPTPRAKINCRAVVPPAPATVRTPRSRDRDGRDIIRYAAKYRSGACALPYPTEMPRAIAAFPFSATDGSPPGGDAPPSLPADSGRKLPAVSPSRFPAAAGRCLRRSLRSRYAPGQRTSASRLLPNCPALVRAWSQHPSNRAAPAPRTRLLRPPHIPPA